MKYILLFSLFVGTLAACTKGRFEDTPQVRIKSFGPDVVVKGQIFRLVAEITDKQGDLQDSVLLVRKRFTNGTTQVPARNDDSVYVNLQSFGFPNAPTMELQIDFAYGEDLPNTRLYNIQETVDRGVKYEIIISDKAKHKSQKVETRMITLKKV